MPKPSSRRRLPLAIAGIVVLTLAGLGALYAVVLPGNDDATEPASASASEPSTGSFVETLPYQPHTWGDPDAPVEILEFSSYTCPHCSLFHQEAFPILKERYIDTGKARLVLVDFPLDNVAGAVSLVTHCAPPDVGLKLSEIFYGDPKAWMTRTPAEAIAGIARLGGMTQEDIDACLSNEPLYQAIIDGRSLADERYDIKGTPTFVINDQKHEGGHGIDTMSAAIEAALDEAGE